MVSSWPRLHWPDRPPRLRCSRQYGDASAGAPFTEEMERGMSVRMSAAAMTRLLLKRLPQFRYRLLTATCQSGYGAVCKAIRFAFIFNGHSEKSSKFASFPINRLARVSECAVGAAQALWGFLLYRWHCAAVYFRCQSQRNLRIRHGQGTRMSSNIGSTSFMGTVPMKSKGLQILRSQII